MRGLRKRITKNKAVAGAVGYAGGSWLYVHASITSRGHQAGVHLICTLFGFGVSFALYDTRRWCALHGWEDWEDPEEEEEEEEEEDWDEVSIEEARKFMRLSTAAPRLLDLLKQYHACHRAFSANNNWTSMDEAVRAEAESVIAELDAPVYGGRTIN